MKKGRKKNADAARWGKAVRGVLRKASVRSKAVAEKAFGRDDRFAQSLLAQYLSGVRRPSPDRVRAIAAAVGDLVGPSAGQYLDAEAWYCDLLDADDNKLVRDGLAAFELVIGKVPRAYGPAGFELAEPGFGRRLLKGIAALHAPQRRTLLVELHRAHRKLLYLALERPNRARMESGFRTLRMVLSRYGISLDVLLRDEEGGTPEQLALEAEWHGAIARALAVLCPDSSARERLAAQRAIESARNEYFNSHWLVAAVGAQGSDFAFDLWRGHSKSRELGIVPAPIARAYRKQMQRRREARQRRSTVRRFLHDSEGGDKS
jgi:hypothetical protein